MNRRKFLKMTAISGAVLAVSPKLLPNTEAKAEPKKIPYEKVLNEITGGKTPTNSADVKLIAPAIAENGAVVPVKVEVKRPIEEVKAIHILAKKNFNPRSVSVYLSPQNGKPYFSTRIRLAKTMDVVALVELSNGEFIKAEKPVKVTIGGCG
jgi:sulfur-oxidizing protein SoxY